MTRRRVSARLRCARASMPSSWSTSTRCCRSRVRPSAIVPAEWTSASTPRAAGARAAGPHPWATGRCCRYTRRGCPSGSLRWSVSVWIPKLPSGLRPALGPPAGLREASRGVLDRLTGRHDPTTSHEEDALGRDRSPASSRRARRLGRRARGRRPPRRLGRGRRQDRGARQGDPARGFTKMLGGDMPFNPPFEIDNRVEAQHRHRPRQPVGLDRRARAHRRRRRLPHQRPPRRARAARPRPDIARGPLPAPRLLRRSPASASPAPSATAPRTTSARSGPARASPRC